MATIRTFTITAAALAMLTLAGCSHEEGAVPGGTEPIRFTATTAGGTAPASAGLSAVPTTRTMDGGNEWATADRVGIFVVTAGSDLNSGLVDGYDNMKYKPVTDNSPTTDLIPADGQPVYWPGKGASFDFVAYYPYGDSVNGEWKIDDDYALAIDISEQSDPEAIDVLYARKENAAPGRNVELTFDHALAKVRLNIKKGDGISAGDLTDMTATLLGLPTTARLSLSDGTLSAEADADNVSMNEKNPGTGIDAAFEAIVLPSAAGGQQVKFTFDDMTPLYWAVPDDHDLPAGKTRVYELTVSATGIELSGSSIAQWTANDNTDGSGDMEYVGVVQPEANSYMVVPDGDPILIPVSQANRVLGDDGLGAKTDGLGGVKAGNLTVELVWGDTRVGSGEVVEEIQPYGEYVYVKPGPTAGNMVIAIKDKESGKIKWSWHIWVTEPVESGKDGATGLTWMDRNLGAKANTPYVNDSFDNDQWVKTLGVFYQWGRKDAFPGSNGSNTIQQYYTHSGGNTSTNDNLTGSYTQLPDMVKNPLSFTTDYDNYYGSLSTGTDNKSWSGTSGEKTLYDPCPPGWKVPPISVDSKNVWGSNNDPGWQTLNDKGRIFNGVNGNAGLGHYYPAAGRRNYNAGTLSLVGSFGYWWSASISGTYDSFASYLYFNTNGVNPINNSHRAHGFSVRCVADIN